jgi:nucleotidyltransferase/DNA polymerase involved in DNA repair
VSILYCAIPHFAAALARRDDPSLAERPLVLIGPGGRVLGASAEATACGVATGLTARAAEVRCPEAQLLDVDLARVRDEFEILVQLLERTSHKVEPHGWGAVYADLSDLAHGRKDAVEIGKRVGRAVRQELGQALQPAVGWDSSKFTAQAAARRTRPGHLLVVDGPKEPTFLQPLPVTLLPLSADTLRRLGFLGLRTLGQYAALPPAAVGQQFGRAGQLAQRYAQGRDDRPVVPRSQAPRLTAACELETPLAERERLLVALKQLITPVLTELREKLQAPGRVRLRVDFDDGGTQERTHTFLFPTTNEAQVLQICGQMLDKMGWTAGAVALAVAMEQIQDAVVEQLSLFSTLRQAQDVALRQAQGQVENERERKLREVQRYLADRFGASRLRRAILSQPGAPLPEWRVGWVEADAR